MPHQFAFEQGLRHGSAVDGHEGLVATGALHMNSSGDQLFAGAAFTLDQNSAGITLGDLAHHVEHLLHMAAVTDNVFDAELAFMGGAQVSDLLAKLTGFERLLDDNRQFVEIERLVDIIIRTETHSLDSGLKHAKGRNHDHDNLAVDLLDLFQHLKAIHAGQLDVKQHQLRGVFLNHPQGILATGGCHYVVALFF